LHETRNYLQKRFENVLPCLLLRNTKGIINSVILLSNMCDVGLALEFTEWSTSSVGREDFVEVTEVVLSPSKKGLHFSCKGLGNSNYKFTTLVRTCCKTLGCHLFLVTPKYTKLCSKLCTLNLSINYFILLLSLCLQSDDMCDDVFYLCLSEFDGICNAYL
jgi:hypothetical protein